MLSQRHALGLLFLLLALGLALVALSSGRAGFWVIAVAAGALAAWLASLAVDLLRRR